MLGPEDRALRRRQYADALWRIAERDGVERASMRAIASEAGTSLGMLQHHFADKDELLALAIRDRMQKKHAGLIRSIERLGSDPEPAAVLVAALRHRLPLTSKLRTEARVLQYWLVTEARSPLQSEVLVESEQVLTEVIGRALGAARSQSLVSGDLDVAVLTSALLVLNDGLMRSLMLGRHTAAEAKEIIETQVRAVLRAPQTMSRQR
ncbi:MAG: TetR/AcrR family transcriptional regulator [Acidimicrobiia bacterium]|nr:TetR/AcrR family transcriptional regulator [Acidimicrobiia bacterium]